MNQKRLSEHIVWTNKEVCGDKNREYFDRCYPHFTESQKIDCMYHMTETALKETKEKLDIEMPLRLVGFVTDKQDSGKTKYSIINPGVRNISRLFDVVPKDVLIYEAESTMHITEIGDLVLKFEGEDGTLTIMFRMWKENATEDTAKILFDKWCAGHAYRCDITKYTYRLGDYVAKVYGWQISYQGMAKTRMPLPLSTPWKEQTRGKNTARPIKHVVFV